MNLAIVRLACCCGLRASEIGGLQLGDVVTGTPRPHIRVRREVAKGGRPRRVPLWWDAGTLRDIEAWKELRQRQGAGPEDPLVCSTRKGTSGQPLNDPSKTFLPWKVIRIVSHIVSATFIS